MTARFTLEWYSEYMGKMRGKRAPPDPGVKVKAGFRFEPPSDPMNKTERRYANEVLAPARHMGEILDYWYESITFVLADRTTYTPDFLIICPDRIRIVEIKGRLEDDASVKFKMARKMWPYFEWEMIRRKGGLWVQVRI